MALLQQLKPAQDKFQILSFEITFQLKINIFLYLVVCLSECISLSVLCVSVSLYDYMSFCFCHSLSVFVAALNPVFVAD
jgi:hypothetical protein